MELLHIVSQQYIHINQKNCSVNFLWKMTFSPKIYPHLKTIQKFSKIKNLMLYTSQTPIQCTTFHQYTPFTKYLCLLRYGNISTFTPHFFCTSKFDLFDLRNLKIQNWQIPSSCIISNPKWTKRAQEITNQSSSWPWNCCTHTFGRCCL